MATTSGLTWAVTVRRPTFVSPLAPPIPVILSQLAITPQVRQANNSNISPTVQIMLNRASPFVSRLCAITFTNVTDIQVRLMLGTYVIR